MNNKKYIVKWQEDNIPYQSSCYSLSSALSLIKVLEEYPDYINKITVTDVTLSIDKD